MTRLKLILILLLSALFVQSQETAKVDSVYNNAFKLYEQKETNKTIQEFEKSDLIQNIRTQYSI